MLGTNNDPVVYIGYEPREAVALDIMVASIKRYASRPVRIVPIIQSTLRQLGLYRRGFYEVEGQKYDEIDNKPFSTEFSFTRFLTPILNLRAGWALFMDCDMYWRGDIWELLDNYCDETKALMVVKHDYNPTESVKMDNQIQENYSRKNWSSVMYFNCAHPANNKLTVDTVNLMSGNWLHNFRWLPEYRDRDLIGELPEKFNWLDHWSSTDIEPMNVHWTTGGPFFDDWIPANEYENIYADEWTSYLRDITQLRNLK